MYCSSAEFQISIAIPTLLTICSWYFKLQYISIKIYWVGGLCTMYIGLFVFKLHSLVKQELFRISLKKLNGIPRLSTKRAVIFGETEIQVKLLSTPTCPHRSSPCTTIVSSYSSVAGVFHELI